VIGIIPTIFVSISIPTLPSSTTVIETTQNHLLMCIDWRINLCRGVVDADSTTVVNFSIGVVNVDRATDAALD
jgi:hypothetical protein